MLTFLAQASGGGLNGVPAEFVKYFVITAAFFGGLWFSYRRGKAQSGSKDEPVNIAQPVGITVDTEVKVRQVPEWAIKSEVAEELKSLDEKLVAMGREATRSHSSLEKRIEASNQAGQERRVEILNALHESEQRTQGTVLQEARKIHERLNPVAESVAAHEAALEQIQARMAAMEKQHHDDHARISTRIDDAIRAASSRKS